MTTSHSGSWLQQICNSNSIILTVSLNQIIQVTFYEFGCMKFNIYWYMFYRKFRNNDSSFQLKRHPSLGRCRIMKHIFGIARLFCMTLVFVLFIGGCLSCKSAESGSHRAQNTEEMVSVWDIYRLWLPYLWNYMK